MVRFSAARVGGSFMAAAADGPAGWAQLAAAMYGLLIERGAAVECTFEGLEVQIPRDGTGDAPPVRVRVDGTLRIRTFEPPTAGPR
jgi:hypothetical protein